MVHHNVLRMLQQLRESRRTPSELLGVDLGSTGTKMVKLKKESTGFAVTAVDILPAITWNGSGPAPDSQLQNLQNLPKSLRANYAALTASSEKAIVRLLSLPGNIQASEAIEAHLREHAGLEGQYRLAYSVTQTTNSARGKPETRFLAVAMPEVEAKSIMALVPSGPPAPWSLEVSALGALTAFLRGPGARHAQEAVGVIESGARVTLLALFSKNALVLVRKFDFGFETLVNKVQQQLGVDREVAHGIISDGSFDISGCVRDVMGPFLRQLSISRDFVERQEKCRIGKLYLSGGMSLSKYWGEEIKNGTKLEVVLWNPFDGVQLVPGAYPDLYRGQQTRFTAALGAAMGVFEE